MGPGEKAYVDTAGLETSVSTASACGRGAVVSFGGVVWSQVRLYFDNHLGVITVGGAEFTAEDGCGAEVSKVVREVEGEIPP